MANITEIIAQQVAVAAGKVEIPADIKEQVLNGLSDSILGSLKQTATSPGGIDALKGLLTGKSSAASSPVTELAGKLFSNNVLGKLGLGKSSQGAALSALIPIVMGKLSGILQDKDGDGNVDLNDILLTLQGGSSKKAGSGLLGAATSILGGMLKK